MDLFHFNPDLDPCRTTHFILLFCQLLSKWAKIFGLLLIEGTFTSVFKDNKSPWSLKTVCEPDAGMLMPDWHCWIPTNFFPTFLHLIISAEVTRFSSLLILLGWRIFTRRTSLGVDLLFLIFLYPIHKLLHCFRKYHCGWMLTGVTSGFFEDATSWATLPPTDRATLHPPKLRCIVKYWATLPPIELISTLLSYVAPSGQRCTLQSYAAPYRATLHLLSQATSYWAKLHCMSYAAPCWALLHPSELRCILLSYDVLVWATVLSTLWSLLRCTLLSYATLSELLFIHTERPLFE